MSKNINLNQTQNIKCTCTPFRSTDLLSAYKVLPNAVGTNINSGTRTFTAATAGSAIYTSQCSWSCAAKNVTSAATNASQVVGPIYIINPGDYKTVPTDCATNAASVDAGSSDATWTILTGITKNIYQAGSDDSVIKAINVQSTDSAARTLTLMLCDTTATGTFYNSVIGSVSIPANSGNPAGSTATLDLLSGTLFPSLPYDANGKRVLPVPAGYVVKAALNTAPTAAKVICVQVFAEDY